jgi:hypothetical protein
VLCSRARGLAGRPWCPPSLLRQSSAFRSGKAANAAVYLFGLRPLHLCGTRLEGGHQGLSRRYGQLDGEPSGWMWPPKWAVAAVVLVRPFRLVSAFLAAALPRADDRDRRARVDRLAMAMATSQQPKQRRFVGSTARTSAMGRAFGAHPRGEFRTSGAAAGQ